MLLNFKYISIISRVLHSFYFISKRTESSKVSYRKSNCPLGDVT